MNHLAFINFIRAIGLAVAFGGLGACGSFVEIKHIQPIEQSLNPVVQTAEGPVRGFSSQGITKFLGIPYAEPPIGDLRWRPPKAPVRRNAVLHASEFAPGCAITTTLGVYSGPQNNNEDCLYLNVFTPELHSPEPLPVIVFIHGGGNYSGEANGYNGSKLASQGKAIIVTMGYRLNLMGFLAHPALDNEGHPFGNYGILDQQAALKWVKQNISKFGGDKENVTLGGQSTGSIDVLIHMVSPLATGLFQRAICQSSCFANIPLANRDVAETTGIAFAEAAGCGRGTSPEVARCLRNLPASRVLELAGTATAPSKLVTSPGIVDGQIIPDQLVTLIRGGRFNRVPLISGSTKDEWNFFAMIAAYWTNSDNALRTVPTAEQFLKFVNITFVQPKYPEGTAAKVLALYPLSNFKSVQSAWNRTMSDLRVCDARRLTKILAQHVPVYAYEFSDDTAPNFFPDMPGIETGAYHAADIQYLFPLWHGSPLGTAKTLNSQQTKLSDQMVLAWANFARTGNPNLLGNAPWPRYTESAGVPAWSIQDLPKGSSLTDEKYAAARRCDFWDGVTSGT